MAPRPSLLQFALILTIFVSSGCASWHYRKEAKREGVSSASGDGGGLAQKALEGLSYDSLHNWGAHGDRW